MARDRSTESYAAAGRARWKGTTREQRVEGMRPAHEARVTVAEVDQKVEFIGALSVDMLAELRALRTELAELRSERVAA